MKEDSLSVSKIRERMTENALKDEVRSSLFDRIELDSIPERKDDLSQFIYREKITDETMMRESGPDIDRMFSILERELKNEMWEEISRPCSIHSFALYIYEDKKTFQTVLEGVVNYREDSGG